MVNHYSIDFKYTAVNLYLKINSIRQVSLLLDCSKTSIQRWLYEYIKIEKKCEIECVFYPVENYNEMKIKIIEKFLNL
jgi:transposase-like protein